jgi:uncharacterized membrane protein
LGFAVLAFLFAPWPLYDKLWAIAYGICPQRPGHSLFFGDVQMPIEAREGGMFAGFLLGLIYLAILGHGSARKLPPGRILALLIGFVVLMGLDGLNAVAFDLYLPTPYVPNLFMRLGTGLLTGLAFAGILVPIFNQSIWQQKSKPIPSLSNWRHIAPALLLLAIFWAAGLSGWKPFLYPISIVAIFGQVALMVGLGTMTASILLRRGGQVSNFTELVPLILLGLIAVAAMLGVMSVVRYALFGPGSIPALR